MNIDQIHYLEAINQQHSIRKASDTLHITPQALSQSISALEYSLNLQLVETSHKGTYLTQHGHTILEAGSLFLQTLKEVQASKQPKQYRYLPLANLSILATNGLSNTLLPKLIAQLYLDFPNIKISLNDAYDGESILNNFALKDNPQEIAFISTYKYEQGYLPDIHKYPNITFHPLSESKYCCCIPKNHEIYHYNSLSINTALKYPILITTKGESILRKLLETYSQPKKIISVPNFSVYKELLQISSYLSFSRLSSSLELSIESDNRKIIPFKENIHIYFGYISKSNRTLSPLIQEFLDYTKIYCKHHYGD